MSYMLYTFWLKLGEHISDDLLLIQLPRNKHVVLSLVFAACGVGGLVGVINLLIPLPIESFTRPVIGPPGQDL